MTATANPRAAPPPPEGGWPELAAAQWAWVDSVGWHNKSALEAVALIASEIGETSAEVLADPSGDSAETREEAADIALRLLDFGHSHGTDFSQLTEHTASRAQVGAEDARGILLTLIAWLGKVANLCRDEQAIDRAALGEALCRMLAGLECFAERLDFDLKAACRDKMRINAARGTRGRKK